MIKFDTVFKNVLREVGMLEALIGCLASFAEDVKEDKNYDKKSNTATALADKADNDEGDSDADGADDDVINQQDKSDQLTAFLALAKLSHVEDRLREEGYEEIDDFTDATDADLKECGFKKPEIKRLRRYLTSPTKNK